MLRDESIDALLSSKGPSCDELLSASPTLEGKLETALWKIGRMEDMDTQLRSQLEKFISERNQLSAEKAARDIEIQHLQAQVELLEADSAGRHSADSTPGSPREPEADKITSLVESLQADNERLQHQVESAGYEISDLQSQLHQTQQQVQHHRQTTSSSSSYDESLVSSLRAQISKSEYEVARQAAQILELQGEVTKAQVSSDKSALRQTEANAQLTRQDSTVSRYAATNTHLQDQLQEAQITAASQHSKIAQLESELADSKQIQLRTQEQCACLEAEAEQQKELAAKQSAETQKLQAQLDESTGAVASAAAAEEGLQGQLQVQLEQQRQQKKQYEEELEGLRASASTSANKQESLQVEVLSMKTDAAEQLAHLQQNQREVQSLQQELESAGTARSASEHSLSEQTERSRHELAKQQDTVKRLQEQLADAQSKLRQVQSDTAEEGRQAVAQQEAASMNRQEVTELKAELKKAQEEVASLADARSLLQQQLGERTILLGQKAHQTAHLTAQLNEAKGLPGSSPHEGKAGNTKKRSLSPAKLAQGGTVSSPQSVTADTPSGSASVSPVATPMQPASAANKETAITVNSVQSRSTKGGSTVATKDSPITPLQEDPDYPQRREYTPSESDLSSGAKPSARPRSASQHAQHSCNGGSSGGQTQPVLEGKFDQVKRQVAEPDGDSRSSARSSGQQSVMCTPVNSPAASQVQTQLSSPHSCPSTPTSQMGITHDSNDGYRSVTHVNSCFAKSDDEEEERGDSSSGSSVHQDQHATAANLHTIDTGDERLRMSDMLQGHSKSLKAACKASSQATPNARESSKEACHLQELEERLAECQFGLDVVTERALSAEIDLKATLAALSDADKVMSSLVSRKEAAEVISVISGCIAAFVTTAATTVYWLY